MDPIKNRRPASFGLQLKLVLWKNWTTKKRHPIITFFELLIPVVLFIILMLIRRSQHAVPIHTNYYPAQPLLSAGVVPVLQTFCPTSNSKESVFTRPNPRLQSLLSTVDSALKQFEPFLSNGTAGNMESTLNQTFGNVLSQFEKLTQNQDLSIGQFLTDVSTVTDVLSQYDVTANDITALLHSNINKNMVLSELFALLTDSSNMGEIGEFLQLFSTDQLMAFAVDAMCSYETQGSLFLPSTLIGQNQLDQMLQDICSLDVDTQRVIAQTVVDNLDAGKLQEQFGDTKSLLESDEFEAVFAVLALGDKLGDVGNILPLTTTCPTNHKDIIGKVSNKDQRLHHIKTTWGLIQSTLCGTKDTDVTAEATASQTKVWFSEQQKNVLKLVMHLLDKSPKILYAPNNTAANTIIQQLNASLSSLETFTKYTQQWMEYIPTRKSTVRKWLDKISTQLPNNTYLTIKHRFESLTTILDNIACTWMFLIKDIDFNVFTGFASEAELEQYFLREMDNTNITVVAGVVFQGFDEIISGELPRHVRYKIRQNAAINPPTDQIREPLWFPSPGSNRLFYYNFGFVWIQDVIERAIISLQAGRPIVSPGTMLHRMPYPCWLWDSFVWLIKHIVPLCLILAWVYSVAVLVQRIVYEKEKRLKEVMKIMGLSDGVHWCGWFITAWLQMTFKVTLLTLVIHFGRILPYSDPFIVFVYLELFAISSIAFSFLVSSCFSKAKLAAACAGIFYFLTVVPYMFISVREDLKGSSVPTALKVIFSFLSPTALGFGGKYFLFYELEGSGVHWYNITRSPIENDSFTLLHVLIMMCADSVLYFVLAWYIENVFPGAYGISKPWYFPFTRSYWFGTERTRSPWNLKRLFGIRTNRYTIVDSDNGIEGETPNHGGESIYWCGCHGSCECSFEREDHTMRAGVVVNNLRKTYTKSATQPALDGLSMKLYEDQITAFLGHNGAGKTTTMDILCGVFPPTTGTAQIYGKDIRTDMPAIRQDLGMCPQHNVLFESLTVEEHIWFYSRLKGITEKESHLEIIRMLRDLTLVKKRSSLPAALSGGMQRKLSIAMAFIGGARTVILDEPTAGVDPHSRRAIWGLLSKYKSGRTVLVSTHHLDEAESIGDRVVIIADGKAKCAGSITYLKSALGDGYHLHIRKDSEQQNNTPAVILDLIKEYIPRAFLRHVSFSEIHITLPASKEERRALVEMFKHLDDRKQELCIKSFDVTDPGLEQVFVKVTTGSLGRNNGRVPDMHRHTSLPPYVTLPGQDCEMISLAQSDNIRSHANSPPKEWSLFSQFKAMLAKRLRYSQRNRKALLSQIVLPAMFVSVSMTIALTAPQISDPPPIVLSTVQFHDAFLPRGNFIPFSVQNPHRQTTFQPSNQRSTKPGSSNDMNTLTKEQSYYFGPSNVQDTFFLPSGLGSTCLLKESSHAAKDNHSKIVVLSKDDFISECSQFAPDVGTYNTNPQMSSQITKFYEVCPCTSDNVGLSCDNMHASAPPQWNLVTNDILQNITSPYDDDDTDYYLYTTQRYRLHRYGGFSFKKSLPYVPDRSDISDNVRRYMDLLTVRDTNEVWYSNKGFHAMPTYLNVLNNAILRGSIPRDKGDPATYGITVTNHPIKQTSDFLNSEYIMSGTDVLMAIFIIVAMSFVPASFVVFLVHERAVKAKHLQLSSGLHPVTYWLSNYLWDMCNYMIPGVCIIAILLAFQIQAYVGHGNFEAVVLLFLVYGFAITPMMYPASFLFTEPSVAYICLIVINLFTGITCVVCSSMLKLFDFDQGISTWGRFLGNLFLVFPNYCLGNGMMSIALNHYQNEYYLHIGEDEKVTAAMNWQVAKKKLVAMVIVGVVSFLFTILCEYGFFKRTIKCKKSKTEELPDDECTDEDSDVRAEAIGTLHAVNNNHVLRLERLSKTYTTWRREKLSAVKSLSFSVARGECFGLLGVNGAGKTTTFRMLTGDLIPSRGDVKLLSESVIDGGRYVQRGVGYCPQFEALFHELTPTEHLYLFARLRGIPSHHQYQAVKQMLTTLGLYRYKDQPSGTLSGGNKRKLSTAIALIGDPKLVILDEPTSGMDPYTRRFLWNVIQNLVDQGTSVVFSSHSMEECEALCSRLSIMVDGRLRCMGSVQHLKDKYGSGYTVTLALDPSGQDVNNDRNGQGFQGNMSTRQVDSVHAYVMQQLTGARVKHKGSRTLVYEMKLESGKLSDLFQMLEDIPPYLGVKDYSVSQNTLDNVFINFANGNTCVDDDPLLDANSDDTISDSFMDNNAIISIGDDERFIEMTPRTSSQI